MVVGRCTSESVVVMGRRWLLMVVCLGFAVVYVWKLVEWRYDEMSLRWLTWFPDEC